MDSSSSSTASPRHPEPSSPSNLPPATSTPPNLDSSTASTTLFDSSAATTLIDSSKTRALPKSSTSTTPPDPSNAISDAPEKAPLSSKAPSLSASILHFVTTASNEQLGLCALGLAFATWLVLGRVGILLIGIFAGIVAHATWESTLSASSSGNGDKGAAYPASARASPDGFDLARKVLSWHEARQSDTTAADSHAPVLPLSTPAHRRATLDGKLMALEVKRPETTAALHAVIEAIVQDYVQHWYSPVLPLEQRFSVACRQMLLDFATALAIHLERKRPATMFLEFLTHLSSVSVVFLKELSNAIAAPFDTDEGPEAAIQAYLAEHPNSNLANVMDNGEQERKLRAVADDFLQAFLDPTALACQPVRVFLREIFSGVILESILQTSARAETINEWIVYLLEGGEPSIINAIDAGVGGVANAQDPLTTSLQPPSRPSTPPMSKSDSNLLMSPGPPLQKRASERALRDDADAMEEARRLNELIAAGEHRSQQPPEEVASSTTSDLRNTPSSSQDNLSTVATSVESPPRPSANEPESEEAPALPPRSFTSFDQMVSPSDPTPIAPLTLHHAKVSIFSDDGPGESRILRAKPVLAEFLLQIEPSSAHYQGWMAMRRYSEFETLHETLGRIAMVSGAKTFALKYKTLPTWKAQTKESLAQDLQAYVSEAFTHSALAESEAMRRFAEKDQGLAKQSSAKPVLPFATPEAFQTMGKGMLDVLVSAPKGAAQGGKALIGGVSGVFAGNKRTSVPPPPSMERSRSASMTRSIPPLPLRSSSNVRLDLQGPDSVVSLPSVESSESLLVPPALPNRPSGDTFERRHALSMEPEDEFQPTNGDGPLPMHEQGSSRVGGESANLKPGADSASGSTPSSGDIMDGKTPQQSHRNTTASPPLDVPETQAAVDLMFAMLNALFTLSSAWAFRRTLLNAARVYLTRPGNPSLESIRTLLQETVIEAHTSDAGLATLLGKLRANSLPTPAELAAWPAPRTPEAQEQLRRQARALLLERGLPPALVGVMGAAASSEALGHVFDALQQPAVARGLVFAVLLQSVRVVIH